MADIVLSINRIQCPVFALAIKIGHTLNLFCTVGLSLQVGQFSDTYENFISMLVSISENGIDKAVIISKENGTQLTNNGENVSGFNCLSPNLLCYLLTITQCS